MGKLDKKMVQVPATSALILGFVLLSAVGAAAHSAGGNALTSAQTKCTTTANKNWSKVSKVVKKNVQKCLKNYATGAALAGDPAIDTLEECVGFDVKGKLQKTKNKTSAGFDATCGGPNRVGVDDQGFPKMPEYGATSPATVNAAAQAQETDLAHDIFGVDLDAAGLIRRADSGDATDASKCQQKVLKTAAKCMLKRQKQFTTCVKTHLAAPGLYGLIYDVDDLALCYDGLDAAKLQKKCLGDATSGIHKEMQRCEDSVSDRTLSVLFGGCATDDPAAAAVCVDQRVRCRFCVSANAAAGATRDCDLFDDGDSLNSSCLPCPLGSGFESTFAAIQSIIFDSPTYGCSNGLCHGGAAPQGGLDLSDNPATPEIDSYARLINVAGTFASPAMDRVEPGEPSLSFLYNKLAAATLLGHLTGGGSPMPGGGNPALSPEHLEAIEKWIRGGAPENLNVAGTSLLLATCLPADDPLTIAVPDPPVAGAGVQLQQTPWDLPAQSENEICMSTFYDLTAPGLVPASAKVACPPQLVNVNNPSGECFAYKSQTLWQDSQSHHSIIHAYTGVADDTDSGWGSWTYKFQDQSNPLEGTSCNPKAVDGTGANPGCSGDVVRAAACIGYGPSDYGNNNNTAPTFSGSQEPFTQAIYPDGVYNILPMSGIVVWNSHAFNLTGGDTTMSQYLNLDFALGALEQQFPVQAIFDAASIFVTDVQPFDSQEYCRTYTIPQGAALFELSSHTHRHGVLWRTWAPPNTPCLPGQAACVARPDTPLYLSTDYTDPLQLGFDPPVPHGTGTSAAAIAARTYLYCSLYDNGVGPGSPEVKRRSTSPVPPLPFGGPCKSFETQCIGPNQGTLCSGLDSLCESSPGAGDGDCDACPVTGGLTSEDEMFILIGSYYIP